METSLNSSLPQDYSLTLRISESQNVKNTGTCTVIRNLPGAFQP